MRSKLLATRHRISGAKFGVPVIRIASLSVKVSPIRRPPWLGMPIEELAGLLLDPP
jgi:hypothetical protein